MSALNAVPFEYNTWAELSVGPKYSSRLYADSLPTSRASAMSHDNESCEVPPRVREELLAFYGLQIRDRVRGGLSAATIWKCAGSAGTFCLRRWPPEHPTEPNLRMIHTALCRAKTCKLDFVPRVFPTSNGESFVNSENALWELTQWMPGVADYLTCPSVERLTNALHALADLHVCWNAWSPVLEQSRAVENRIELLQRWLDGTNYLGSIAKLSMASDLAGLSIETCRTLQAFGPQLLEELTTIRSDCLPLHPILRDVWSDHILFDGDRVTGIIDYGALAIDSPAADLARMLGSLEPDDRELRQFAVELYHQHVGSEYPVWQLVDLLDRSGTLLAAVQWMDWLVFEQREFASSRDKLVTRWRSLLSRANQICAGDAAGRKARIWLP